MACFWTSIAASRAERSPCVRSPASAAEIPSALPDGLLDKEPYCGFNANARYSPKIPKPARATAVNTGVSRSREYKNILGNPFTCTGTAHYFLHSFSPLFTVCICAHRETTWPHECLWTHTTGHGHPRIHQHPFSMINAGGPRKALCSFNFCICQPSCSVQCCVHTQHDIFYSTAPASIGSANDSCSVSRFNKQLHTIGRLYGSS